METFKHLPIDPSSYGSPIDGTFWTELSDSDDSASNDGEVDGDDRSNFNIRFESSFDSVRSQIVTFSSVSSKVSCFIEIRSISNLTY